MGTTHNFSSKRLNINSKEIKKIRSFVKRNKCKIISSCSDTGQKLVNKVNNKSNISRLTFLTGKCIIKINKQINNLEINNE